MAVLDEKELCSLYAVEAVHAFQVEIRQLHQHHWKDTTNALGLRKLLNREASSYNMVDYDLNTHIKFVVREEHLLLYDSIEKKHQARDNNLNGIYLTGQPGIGKSTFSHLILLDSLHRAIPSLLLQNGKWYMFCQAGVFHVHFEHGRTLIKYIQERSEDPKLRPRIFVDVRDLSPGSVHLPSEVRAIPAFVLFSSSLGSWEILRKTNWLMFKILLMNPWTETELKAVAKINGWPWQRIEPTIRNYGPSMRNLLTAQYEDEDLTYHQKKLDVELDSALSSHDFRQGFKVFTRTGGDAASVNVHHRIFWLMRREDERDFESLEELEGYRGLEDVKGVLSIPTNFLQERVLQKINEKDNIRRQWLRDIISAKTLSRSTATSIYENSFIRALQEKLTLNLYSMHLCEKNFWRTHSDVLRPCLNCEEKPADHVNLPAITVQDPIPFGADTDLISVLTSFTDKKEWTLWIPQAFDNGFVDFILVRTQAKQKNTVYYCQCTLSENHDGKPVSVTQRFSGPEWVERYVFISPRKKFSCSKLDIGDGVRPYFAQWGN